MLLNAKGLLLASVGDMESLQSACGSWIEAITIGKDRERADNTPMTRSSLLTSTGYFDEATQELGRLTSSEDAMAAIERLENDISKVLTPF